jgi:8-oxo-dGTP pyrophosphatase MutT (NUDIX family)
MPHIHSKDGQHDHTVSMFIFRTDFDEPKILLHWHIKLFCYLQFGGHIELDEHPTQTIIHELKEETGYDIDQVQILQPSTYVKKLTGAIAHPVPVIYNTHPIGENHFHTDAGYVLVTDQEPAGAPDEGESTDIRLFTRDEVVALPDDKIKPNVKEQILYMFDHTLPNWEPVELSSFEI